MVGADKPTGFPRGPGPLVSILIPSRGRPGDLCRAIDSCVSLAEDPARIEFILKVDDDDAGTRKVAADLEANFSQFFRVETITSPRGRGYADMHEWVNALCLHARGDWLFLFNDDARMATPGWDHFLLHVTVKNWHGVADVACLYVPTSTRPDAEEFMFLRRSVFGILGHYSPIPHNDTWVKTLMKMIDSSYFFPLVVVDHHTETEDDVRREGLPARQTTEYTTHSRGMQMLKLLDALRLQAHIDACQRFTDSLRGDNANP